MMKELINKLEGLKAAEEIANRAEARWEREPENELLEKRFDRAYANEFKYYLECVRLVQTISGGKIDFETAKKLVKTKRGELVKLLNRADKGGKRMITYFDFVQEKGKNFTPATKIYEFAKKYHLDTYNRYGNMIVIFPDGRETKYHHYKITEEDSKTEKVTIYLEDI